MSRETARSQLKAVYFDWASPDYQHLIMPWTVIDGPDSARSFADTLEGQETGTSFFGGLAGGGTSISGALFFSSRLLQKSGPKAIVRSSMFLATAPTMRVRLLRRRRPLGC